MSGVSWLLFVGVRISGAVLGGWRRGGVGGGMAGGDAVLISNQVLIMLPGK